MYEYDQIGNLTLHCTLGDVAYPASGVGSVRPHAVCATGTTSCASPTYQYDLNGNLTSNPTLSSLVYDFENRPTSITKSGVSTTMAYHDLLGRVTKSVSGTTTTYIGRWYECTGGTCTKYIFAGDQRIALKQASTVTYVHADHLASSSVLSNGADGTKNEQLTYYPFGQTRTDTDGAGNPISPGFRYKYTDQELDDTTGLSFYQARYYDPVLGRFIQPDPLVPDLYDPQSLNPYSYVLNNPLRYTDPSGLQGVPLPDPALATIFGLGEPTVISSANPNADVRVQVQTTGSAEPIIVPNLGLSSFLFATTTPPVTGQGGPGGSRSGGALGGINLNLGGGGRQSNTAIQTGSIFFQPAGGGRAFASTEAQAIPVGFVVSGVDPEAAQYYVPGVGGVIGPAGGGLSAILAAEGRTFARFLRSLQSAAAEAGGAVRSVEETQLIWRRAQELGYVIERGPESGWRGGLHLNIKGPGGEFHFPIPPGFIP